MDEYQKKYKEYVKKYQNLINSVLTWLIPEEEFEKGEPYELRVVEMDQVISMVIKPRTERVAGLIIGVGGDLINSLRNLATHGARRRNLHVYISVHDPKSGTKNRKSK